MHGPGTFYGVPLQPGPGQAGSRALSLQDCVKAGQEVLEDTTFLTDQAPWLAAPYRGRRRCDYVRCVVNIGAGIDAAANAAGVALIAAQSLIAAPVIITKTIAGLTPQVLYTLNCPAEHTTVVESWGMTVVNHVPEALHVRVISPSAGGTPTPPNPAISGYQPDQHEPTRVILEGGQQLTIQVDSLDTTTPMLVHFATCYWHYPVKRADARTSQHLRPQQNMNPGGC